MLKIDTLDALCDAITTILTKLLTTNHAKDLVGLFWSTLHARKVGKDTYHQIQFNSILVSADSSIPVSRKTCKK